MRHPNAEEIRARCDAALDDVLDALGLPRGQLTRDDQGWVNVCYLGPGYVVRFNARDPELPKHAREEWAMRALADRGFPVPRVLGRLQPPDAPYPVLVTERLPGSNLEQTWASITPAIREELARQAGLWLARIHRQPRPGFGEVMNPERIAWGAWAHELSTQRLNACRPMLIESEVADLEELLRAAAPHLTEGPPRLVHRDYHFGNLLHDGRNITGILDFEWCAAARPVIDRVAFTDLEAQCPGALAPFLAAYDAEVETYHDTALDVAFWRVCAELELADVAQRFLDEPERMDYRARLQRATDALRDV